MVNNEMKEVTKGMIIRPQGTLMHNVAMSSGMLRVNVLRVVPGHENLEPQIQPEDAALAS
jgi:hypothetical protein